VLHVVASPCTKPVSTSAVRDNPDGLVSQLISAVVEILLHHDNDDGPYLCERVVDSIGVRLRRLAFFDAE
jgi:hypothetical protein